MPDFASLASKSLALDVRDEWSSDGALGENVREQLAKALRAKGIEVAPRAGQRLTVLLRKPDQDFQGRSRDTCLEMRFNASLQRGTAFALATACRGLDEAIHHRVLSEALNVLDTEYAKLQSR